MEGDVDNDSDYIIHTNEISGQKYKVALTHSSLGKKPIHQVHGGCTPEEVIVPFIVISNKGVKPLSSYKVTPMETDIPISNPTVEFTIMPEPNSAIMDINGQSVELKRSSGRWAGEIPDAAEGMTHAVIKPENGIPVEFDIKIIGLSGSSIDDFLGF